MNLKEKYCNMMALIQDIKGYQYDKFVTNDGKYIFYVYEICYYVEQINGGFKQAGIKDNGI